MAEHFSRYQGSGITGPDDKNFFGLDPALACPAFAAFAVAAVKNPDTAERQNRKQRVDYCDAPWHGYYFPGEKAQRGRGEAEKEHGLQQRHEVEYARAAPGAQRQFPDKFGSQQAEAGNQHVPRKPDGKQAEISLKAQVKSQKGTNDASKENVRQEFKSIVPVKNPHGRSSRFCLMPQ
jgi:hypothetical protein